MMLAMITFYLQPILLLFFVALLINQRRTAWIFVIFAYLCPIIREIVYFYPQMPNGYYIYAFGNDLLYLVLAIFGALMWLRADPSFIYIDKSKCLNALVKILLLLLIYVLINLAALPFLKMNFEASGFTMSLYTLGDIFMLTGLLMAALHYRNFVLFLVIAFSLNIVINIYFICEYSQYYLYSAHTYYSIIVNGLAVAILFYGNKKIFNKNFAG